MIPQQSSVQVDEKPPSKTSLDIGARFVSALRALAGRPALCWTLLSGDWRLCPTRTALHGRCLLISGSFQ